LKRALLILGVLDTMLGLTVVLRLETKSPASRTPAKEEALTVEVIGVSVQPMPELLQSVGQVVSQHTVQIRPQVSGMLKQVFFKEGQSVYKGQRLFQIEPASFEAALASARAASENSFVGNAQTFKQLLVDLPLILLATVLVIYMVLAILYESFIHPLTILTVLPLAMVGGLLSLLLFGQELNIFSFVGGGFCIAIAPREEPFSP
jgi:multidrug efflux pump subunit AcrB